jgi:hypothetical protein
MIRYPITPAKLRARIEAHSPEWLIKAAERTDGFEEAGRFTETDGTSMWGDVKEVYMQLQHDKCAYCERQLSDKGVGKAEFDVEHYRPKNGVKVWPSNTMKKKRGLSYDFETGDAYPAGYYLLAYEPLNYAVACKPCNSALKSNYFPIAGPRAAASRSLADYKAEKPFLPYPIGSVDADPETLLEFQGIVPKPVARTGFKSQRARVTIDFLRLADREDLRRERAEVISHMYMARRVVDGGTDATDKQMARDTFVRLQEPTSRHSSCAKAFAKLLDTNQAYAKALFDEIHAFLQSQS